MLNEIVNSPQWEEVEDVIQEKMSAILLDMPDKGTEDIALHALANKKAYNMLDNFFKKMNFLKTKEGGTATPRDYT